ncbi:DUF3008 family protein [Patescibacteria group bacterium]|nr:DUF3008 family protein [Patescibacteria group bacterium]
MPAKSRTQQRLAGMAVAYLKGTLKSKATKAVKRMASMGKSNLLDFARTKHAGLREKVGRKSHSVVKERLTRIKSNRKKLT